MAKAKEARDRVALVTGAASGIGLATVERLLEAGWKVAALDRDEGALASVAGKIGKPQRLFTSTLDVTNEVAAEKAVAMVGEALGRIDGVVNSAGIAADIPALDTPVELFRKILDVNVVGTFIVARAAARLMRHTGGGAIVNISSVAGLRGGKGRSAYGASISSMPDGLMSATRSGSNSPISMPSNLIPFTSALAVISSILSNGIIRF